MKYAVLTKRIDELDGSDFDEEVLNQYGNLTLRKEGLSYTVDGQEVITTTDSLLQDMCEKQIELIFDDFAERVAEKIHEVSEQEPKRGEWIVYPLIDEGRVELECPICGDTSIRAVDCKPHFCENCGAKMKG